MNITLNEPRFLALASILMSFALRATDYYVDPQKGDDAFNGLYETDQKDGVNGPKLTLKGVMTIEGLQAGDVVTALPGVYNKEVMVQDDVWGNNATQAADVPNRVVVPTGVTLRSRDGAEKTFIVGQEATTPVWNGCGTDSARCVYLNMNAKLIGFTVTGGRAQMNSASEGRHGGGIVAAYVSGAAGTTTKDTIGRVEDCVISNNYACSYGAAGAWGCYERCRITGNVAKSAGSALFAYTRLWINDSIVANNSCSYQVLSFSEIRNSTVVADFSSTVLWVQAGTLGQLYNSVVCGTSIGWTGSGSKTIRLHRCALGSRISNVATNVADPEFCPEQDCLVLTSDEMALDESLIPGRASKLVDVGSNAYTTVGNECDAFGVPRILNTTIDIGGVEYDWRKDFSRALDATGAAVVSKAGAAVGLDPEGGVRLNVAGGASTEMTVDWRRVEGFSKTRFGFKASVKGTGTLSVKLGGSDDPYLNVTSADGVVDVAVTSAEDISVRFVYVPGANDEAGATVSDFRNMTQALVSVAHGGVELTGDVTAPGAVVLEPGETCKFAAKRVFDSDEWLCMGVMSNGVLLAFDDYPDGVSFALDGCVLQALRIEAVYAPSPITTWYVDPTNGNDTAYGIHPQNARKTLKGAMEISKLSSGHVVVALPGVYDQGVVTNAETRPAAHDVLNRVVIPAGVTLKSRDGAASAFIMGANATDPIWKGCGTDSVRGAFLNAGAQLIGFTVTGGRCMMWAADGGMCGGGVCVAYDASTTVENVGRVSDCRITDNFAYSGGGGSWGRYERCCVTGNGCRSAASGLNAYTSLWVYDSVVANNNGAYQVLSFNEIRNSTIADTQSAGSEVLWVQSGITGLMYDCVIAGRGVSWSNLKLHRCALSDGLPGASERAADENVCPELDCLVLTADDLAWDDTFVPAKTSKLVDAGLNAYHTVPSESDALGIPRILNATIDIGGVEYDWRKDYAQDICAKTEVSAASQGVVETDAKNVRLVDGDFLTIVWKDAGCDVSPRTFRFAVANGDMTVTLNGEQVTTLKSDGEWTYENGSPTDRIGISFAGEGYADVLKASSCCRGLMLIVR